jgi:hypothetical protein
MSDSSRFKEALRRFDEANARDPRVAKHNGVEVPYELLYADWLTAWVLKLNPQASEELRLAARCQHLCRWEIPRESYPAGRAGYLRWRQDLQEFHARRSGEILREVGYDDAVIARVQALNLKRDLGRDADCQTLEDALCLVFLQHQLAELAAKTEPDKVVRAIRKSWDKMSARGREEALKLEYTADERRLVEEAIRGASDESHQQQNQGGDAAA